MIVRMTDMIPLATQDGERYTLTVAELLTVLTRQLWDAGHIGPRPEAGPGEAPAAADAVTGEDGDAAETTPEFPSVRHCPHCGAGMTTKRNRTYCKSCASAKAQASWADRQKAGVRPSAIPPALTHTAQAAPATPPPDAPARLPAPWDDDAELRRVLVDALTYPAFAKEGDFCVVSRGKGYSARMTRYVASDDPAVVSCVLTGGRWVCAWGDGWEHERPVGTPAGWQEATA